MTDRDRLIELMIEAKKTDPETGSFTDYLAEYLLANGVVVYGRQVFKACEEHGKKERELVEVVRCKECAYRRVPTRCSLWMGTTGENDYFREHGDNFYCAFGTLKERNVTKKGE